MDLRSCIKRTAGRLAVLAATAAALCACGSIFEFEGDCSVSYRVSFRYDYNMKFADAFAHEVSSVSLFVLDEDGRIVWSGSDSGSALAADGYAMDIDVQPGSYEMIAWCGLADPASLFTVADGATSREDLYCRLERSYDEDGQAQVLSDPRPLFHGRLTSCELPDEAGVHYVTVPLTKNTNTVRVVLQHLSGEPVDVDDFDFSVTSDDGLMDYDNSLLPDENIVFHAWSTYSGSAGITVDALPDSRSGATTQVNAAVAEITVPRLCTGHDTRLRISRKSDGTDVLDIPLTDYALLVKGNYNAGLSDQEYLDRQDEFSIVFFLDSGDSWLSSCIYINSWKVVLQDTSF